MAARDPEERVGFDIYDADRRGAPSMYLAMGQHWDRHRNTSKGLDTAGVGVLLSIISL